MQLQYRIHLSCLHIFHQGCHWVGKGGVLCNITKHVLFLNKGECGCTYSCLFSGSFVQGCTDVDLHQFWPSNMERFASHLMHPLCLLRLAYSATTDNTKVVELSVKFLLKEVFSWSITCHVLWPAARSPEVRPSPAVFWFSCPPSLQVNSDVVFYSRKKDGTMEPVKVNKTHVGRMVLTKAPGSEGRRDIVDQYKFPEGQWPHRAQVSVLSEAEEPCLPHSCFWFNTQISPQANLRTVLNETAITAKMQECLHEYIYLDT